jgi:hypothetical protein
MKNLLSFKKNKKCIIITTINKPTDQIIAYSKKNDWDLIIIGDKKTDSNLYKKINCIYLGLNEQDNLFPSLSKVIPRNSYARKNLGYAYAFINKYDLIYDTDDDNYSDINNFINESNDLEVSTNYNFANIYKLYTDFKVWPRGLPIRYIDTKLNIKTKIYSCPVIQGLVDGDPDVDAIFRLTNELSENKFIKFNKDNKKTYSLKPYTFCPFNTQNTYWTQRNLFYFMYLPSTVSMRFTDILRGYIAEHQLWAKSLNIKFTNSNAIQIRNKHCLVKDLSNELEMFQYTERIIEWLIKNKKANLTKIYEWLNSEGIVSELELKILKEWNHIFT